MSVPAYPQYKDSGVAWLGNVPSHWDVAPLWSKIIENRDIVGTENSDIPLLSLTLRGVIARDKESGHGKFPEKFDTYKHVKSGNLVFCLFDIDETPRTVGLSQFDGMITGAYDVFECPDAGTAKYLYYTFLMHDERKSLKPFYTGLRKVIRPATFKSIRLAYPPLTEQIAIAAFLDRETAKIDALVAEQQRLIALLKEKRQAVISHAVTKGLNPNAPMKDSGIEWLGEIPAHWEVRRLKQVALGQLSYGANEAADEAVEDHPRFVRITDVAADGTLRPDTFRSLPPDVAEPYLLQEGDILLARSGGTVGKNFIYRKSWGDCCYAGYLIRLRVAVSTYSSDFVYITLQSNAYWQQLGANQIQSTIQNFSAEKYGDITLAFPPLQEQNVIASELARRLSRFDELSHEAEQAITLLQERRAALISAAVTGKIDVRGLAPAELEPA